jgi:hypothetical protein
MTIALTSSALNLQKAYFQSVIYALTTVFQLTHYKDTILMVVFAAIITKIGIKGFIFGHYGFSLFLGGWKTKLILKRC